MDLPYIYFHICIFHLQVSSVQILTPHIQVQEPVRGATTLTLGVPLGALMPIVGQIGTHLKFTPVDPQELGTHPTEIFHFVSHLVDVSHWIKVSQTHCNMFEILDIHFVEKFIIVQLFLHLIQLRNKESFYEYYEVDHYC